MIRHTDPNKMRGDDYERLGNGKFARIMDSALAAVASGLKVALVTDQLSKEDSYEMAMGAAADAAGLPAEQMAENFKIRQAFTTTAGRSAIKELGDGHDVMIVQVDGIGADEIAGLNPTYSAEISHGNTLATQAERARMRNNRRPHGTDGDGDQLSAAPKPKVDEMSGLN